MFILMLILLVFIWCLPAFMMYNGYTNEWGFLYLPTIILTVLYGVFVDANMD